MNINLSLPRLKMFNTKIKKVLFEKNSIYLNKSTVIEIGVVDGVRWIIVGDAGSGKTYLVGVVLNQFKNTIFFDPTAKFRDILQEIGCEDKWEFFELTPKNNKTGFKMNVNELTHSTMLLDTLFPRAEDTDKKRKQRQAFEAFLNRPQKTFDDFEKMCEENKMDTLYVDLKYILAKNDDAPLLKDTLRGKKVVSCEEISIRNPSIGVFLQSAINYRRTLSKYDRLNPQNFVVIGLDEAQDYCRYQTPVGNAYATLNLQARKFGIGEILVGSAYDNFHPDVRAKSNMKYIFSSPGLTKSYKREGIDIIDEDWEKLGKYECFIFSSDGQYKGATNNDKCLPDLYFQQIRKINKIPEVTIRKERVVWRKPIPHFTHGML